jgi:hypothetical protein
MPEYEIKRWDAVIPPGSTLPYPMIYIQPDDTFMKYVIDNNYIFLLTITGTGTLYDNNKVVGVAESSAFFPDERVNFYNKTKYYCVMLFSNWMGYPPDKGTVFIQGTEGPDAIDVNSIKVQSPVFKPLEWFEPECDLQSRKQKTKVTKQDQCNLSMTSLKCIGIVLIVFLVFVLCQSYET